VQLLLAHGDREDMLRGDFVRTQGTDWPIPGTSWKSLHLDPTPSGTARSINDGTLTEGPAAPATQSYPAIQSLPSATDPYNTSIVGLYDAGQLTDMTLAEPQGLSYTTEPFTTAVQAAGPASAELVLSSTAPESDLYVVLSDVWPDGTAHPMATGRLKSVYPDVDVAKSLVDQAGNIVQPYGVYSERTPAGVGEERRYHVELWPIGNQFEPGHRLRLHVIGASGASQPGPPAIHTIRLGEGASRLLFPVLPGTKVLGAQAHQPDTPRAAPAGGGTLPATGGAGDAALGVGLLVLLAALVSSRVRSVIARR
jgi:putative CocE/NonD family hydrolase